MSYTEQELLDALRECKQKHGEVSYSLLNNDDSLPTGPLYDYRFDSLPSALRKAGLDSEARKAEERSKSSRGGYSKTELLDKLQDVEEEFGYVNTTVLGGEYPSISPYNSKFGSLKEACRKAGVRYGKPKNIKERQQIVEELKEKDKKLDRPVSYEDISVSKSRIKSLFGSISSAREELGLESYRNRLKFEGEYLYVIKFHKDGELAFYVGKSQNIENRLSEHFRENINSEEVSGENLSVERIVSTNSSDISERELSIQIAQEYDTSNVYGGR